MGGLNVAVYCEIDDGEKQVWFGQTISEFGSDGTGSIRFLRSVDANADDGELLFFCPESDEEAVQRIVRAEPRKEWMTFFEEGRFYSTTRIMHNVIFTSVIVLGPSAFR